MSNFDQVYYRGKLLIRNPADRMETIYTDHIYKTEWLGNAYGSKRIHACLQNGWWCWKNFMQKPTDLWYYLKMKFEIL